ncbi:MAG: hypothetical protein K2K21_07280, partial [Lachnospiraceae bacterium]|nr:hypothetical protein [Lachnospiraceae bacterium]
MSIVKKIMALNIIMVILTINLVGCGVFGTEDISDVSNVTETPETTEITADITESQSLEIPDEPIPAPETYEDYRGLSDTYLQMGDVIQALAVLDEGIEKLSISEQGINEKDIDHLSQRKEYILAETVAIRTKYTENEYDYEGYILSSRVLAYDENGRQIYIGYGVDEYTWEYEYDEHGNYVKTIYTSYDKNGDISGIRETEYDASGQILRENYYDANGNLFQYYENEYDDFGSVTRQAMYEDGILKSEKQVGYLYRYIGNIDSEASDYMDKEMAPEEYNL